MSDTNRFDSLMSFLDLNEPSIILSTRNHKHLGQINNITDIVTKNNFNSAKELSFTVHKSMKDTLGKDIVCNLWDSVTDLKLVYIPEYQQYFEITVSIDESSEDITKTITCTSLCEAELSQTMLFDIEINTEKDIERDDYEYAYFYDYEKPERSLLGRVLSKVPNYKLGHIDDSLVRIGRAFSINNSSIYDFLVGKCSEEYNCLFTFDSCTRTINAYDLSSVCNNESCNYFSEHKKKYRGLFYDCCPICKSQNISYLGTDTSILISKDNLSEKIHYETDIGSVKNTFKLTAGDDYMTATIRNQLPAGDGYMYYFSEEQKADMPADLVEALENYDNACLSQDSNISELNKKIYDIIDRINYLESGMMPVYTPEETSAKKICENILIPANLMPLGIARLSNATPLTSLDNVVLNYAKALVNNPQYKICIEGDSSASGVIERSDSNYVLWQGKLRVTSIDFEDDNDSDVTEDLMLEINDNYNTFIEQKVKKLLSDNDASIKDCSLVEIVKLELEPFKKVLTKYCLERLSSFENALDTCLSVMQEGGMAEEENPRYKEVYLPYYDKYTYVQYELATRENEINEALELENKYIEERQGIKKSLNLPDYLDNIRNGMYIDFCNYRREDEYNNSNYISDDLDNAQVLENAKAFIEKAKQDIYKSGESQHVITSDLNNLITIPEFKAHLDKLQLGNWIRLQVNDNIYRLRLISFQIDYSNLENIQVEFSDATKTFDGYNDIQSILSKAKTMATSYSHIQNQAEKVSKYTDEVDDIKKNGLNATLTKIINNDHEETVIDNNGILFRSYDDAADGYSPEQFRITHNVMAYTSDNWKTCRSAIGKQEFEFINENGFVEKQEKYGLNADFVVAGYIKGSEINNGNGTFRVDSNGKMTAQKASVEGEIFAKSGQIGNIVIEDGGLTGGLFSIDKDGKLSAENAYLRGHIEASDGTIGGFNINEFNIMGHNILLSSDDASLKIMDGLTNFMKLGESGISFYDNPGDASINPYDTSPMASIGTIYSYSPTYGENKALAITVQEDNEFCIGYRDADGIVTPKLTFGQTRIQNNNGEVIDKPLFRLEEDIMLSGTATLYNPSFKGTIKVDGYAGFTGNIQYISNLWVNSLDDGGHSINYTLGKLKTYGGIIFWMDDSFGSGSYKVRRK